MVETCELWMNEIKQNCQILQNEFYLETADLYLWYNDFIYNMQKELKSTPVMK